MKGIRPPDELERGEGFALLWLGHGTKIQTYGKVYGEVETPFEIPGCTTLPGDASVPKSRLLRILVVLPIFHPSPPSREVKSHLRCSLILRLRLSYVDRD